MIMDSARLQGIVRLFLLSNGNHKNSITPETYAASCQHKINVKANAPTSLPSHHHATRRFPSPVKRQEFQFRGVLGRQKKRHSAPAPSRRLTVSSLQS